MTDAFFRGARVKAPLATHTPTEPRLTLAEALFVAASVAINDEHVERERFLRLCTTAYDVVTTVIAQDASRG